MNIELMPAGKVKRAEALYRKGDGDALREGASLLLHCKDEDPGADATNGAPALTKLLRALTDDPYRCLGLDRGAAQAAVKKAYRKQALQHHPDKNNNKTTTLFAAIQAAYVRASGKRRFARR